MLGDIIREAPEPLQKREQTFCWATNAPPSTLYQMQDGSSVNVRHKVLMLHRVQNASLFASNLELRQGIIHLALSVKEAKRIDCAPVDITETSNLPLSIL